MRSPRKMLLIALAVVLVGGGAAAGTFASFTASTTNASSTFATGSLVLSNKVNSGSTCFSTGNDTIVGNVGTDTAEVASNKANCTALFTALTASKPGDTATVALTLKNEGNVDGVTGITGLATACSGTDTPNTSGATATLYHGSGNPCSYIQIKVQETASNFTTAVKCMYDASGTFPATCGTGGTVSAFYTANNATPITFNTASVTAGAFRYVVVTLTFPSGGVGAENNYMGKLLSFGIDWTLTQ